MKTTYTMFISSGHCLIVVLICLTHVVDLTNGTPEGSDGGRQVIMNAMEVMLHKQEKLDKWVDLMTTKVDSISDSVGGISEQVKQQSDSGLEVSLTGLIGETEKMSTNAKTVRDKLAAFRTALQPKIHTIQTLVDEAEKKSQTRAKFPKISLQKAAQTTPAPTTPPPTTPQPTTPPTTPQTNRGKSHFGRGSKANHWATSHHHTRSHHKSKPKDEWKEFVKKYDYVLKEHKKKEKAERKLKKKAEREAREKFEREAKEKADREAKEKADREAQRRAGLSTIPQQYTSSSRLNSRHSGYPGDPRYGSTAYHRKRGRG